MEAAQVAKALQVEAIQCGISTNWIYIILQFFSIILINFYAELFPK